MNESPLDWSCRMLGVFLMVAALAGMAEAVEVPEFVLEREPLAYPAEAARERIEGHVVAEITVAENGTVATSALIESTPPGVFDAAVRDWLKGWRFKPACGKAFPYQFQVRVPIQFALTPDPEPKPMVLEPIRPIPPRYVSKQTGGKISLRHSQACGDATGNR